MGRRRGGAREIVVELGLRALDLGRIMRRVGSLSGMGQRGLCLDRATRNPVLNKSVPFFPAPRGACPKGLEALLCR